MIKVKNSKLLSRITFDKLNYLYNKSENKSFLQDPIYIADSDEEYTCFYNEKEEEISTYCFVHESKMQKLSFLKFCKINYGCIGSDEDSKNDLMRQIIAYYNKRNYSDISIDFLLNTSSNLPIQLKLIQNSLLNRGTLLIDLTIEFDDIYNNFSTILKKNYKRSKNLKLEIKELQSEDEISNFVCLHEKLSENRKINIISSEKIRQTLQYIINYKTGIIAGCFFEEKMIGGVACVQQGTRMEYYLGVSDPEYRKLPQSHVTLIYAIQKAQEKDCKWFDLGGAILDLPEDNQIRNITNFKLNFTSNFKKYLPSTILKLNDFRYSLKKVYLLIASAKEHLKF